MPQEIEYINALDSEDPFAHGSEGVLYVHQPHIGGPLCTPKGWLRIDLDDEKNKVKSDGRWSLGPAKEGDVGMDIPVRIKGTDKWPGNVQPKLHLFRLPNGHINFDEGWIDIPVGSYARLPSGIHVKMPDDAWMMVRPRSSTGFKRFMAFFEGTIDSDYTGHLVCLVYNRYRLIPRIFAFIRVIIGFLISIISSRLGGWFLRRTNWGSIRIKDGECLTQLILVPKYPLKKIVDVSKLPDTERGASGFGSSGS